MNRRELAIELRRSIDWLTDGSVRSPTPVELEMSDVLEEAASFFEEDAWHIENRIDAFPEEIAERIAEHMKPYRTTDDELRKIATEIRAAESAARAEGYASGLRDGQERMRERVIAVVCTYFTGHDYIVSNATVRKIREEIRALEVEDSSTPPKTYADGLREGQERMRERAAHLSDSCQIDTGSVDTRQIWTNATATGIARAIRALEVDDG